MVSSGITTVTIRIIIEVKSVCAAMCSLYINPSESGAYFTHCLWGEGFQRYRKSFRISHKPFYSQTNDKE